jgi:SAM-dependent methyltransferase
VEIGRFEEWDPAGRSFDAVIAGQTWHWIDPARGVARAAEILRPAGRLALFWNAGDPPASLAAAFAELYRVAAPALPLHPFGGPAVDGYLQGLSSTATVVRDTGWFDEPEQRRFDWTVDIITEAWLDQVPTFGGFQRLPQDQRAALLHGMAQLVDSAGGSFVMNYSTVLLMSTRRAS